MTRARPHVWLLQRTNAAGGVTVIIDALVPWLHERRPWRVTKVVQRDQAAASALRDRPRHVRFAADAAAAIRLVARLVAERPDVVVTFTPVFGAAAALVARTWGARTIVTHHGTRDAIGGVARRLDLLARRMGAVHAVVGCSEAVASSFVGGPGPVPIAIVNGVPDVRGVHDARLDRAAVADRWGVPQGVPLAVAVGRLAPVKHHALVIEALPGAPGWHLLVAGEGPERAALTARAEALGVAERVHLVGRVPAPTAWSLMALADAYVQPSLAEGLSLALLEALAMGAVCVASDIAPNVEVLRADATGLLLPTDDPRPWAAALVDLAADGARAAALRRRARAAYEARFAESRMLAEYETVIAGAVAG